MLRVWKMISLLGGQRFYMRKPGNERTLYLTFDDGPHPVHTPRFLELLDRHEAKATFFVQGDRAAEFPELLAIIVARGHTLGNHSFSHAALPEIDAYRQAEEIDRADELLCRHDGKAHHVFRPPYGRLTLRALLKCVRRGQPVVLWNHDSMDYRLDSDRVTTRLKAAGIRSGDILLFHDDGETGLNALDIMMPVWRDAGFTFEAL